MGVVNGVQANQRGKLYDFDVSGGFCPGKCQVLFFSVLFFHLIGSVGRCPLDSQGDTN